MHFGSEQLALGSVIFYGYAIDINNRKTPKILIIKLIATIKNSLSTKYYIQQLMTV